jgi:hypothetical protein
MAVVVVVVDDDVVVSDGISDLEIRCSFLRDVDVDCIVAADIADFVAVAVAVVVVVVVAADRPHGRVRTTPFLGL